MELLRDGRILIERQLSSDFVVTAGIGTQHMPEMPPAEDDDVVETFPENRADKRLLLPVSTRPA